AGSAPQFTAWNAPARPDSAWTVRATTSLPVPLSPCSTTSSRDGATWRRRPSAASKSGSSVASPCAAASSGRTENAAPTSADNGASALDAVAGLEQPRLDALAIDQCPVTRPGVLQKVVPRHAAQARVLGGHETVGDVEAQLRARARGVPHRLGTRRDAAPDAH